MSPRLALVDVVRERVRRMLPSRLLSLWGSGPHLARLLSSRRGPSIRDSVCTAVPGAGDEVREKGHVAQLCGGHVTAGSLSFHKMHIEVQTESWL